jgi:hypothetical protein
VDDLSAIEMERRPAISGREQASSIDWVCVLICCYGIYGCGSDARMHPRSSAAPAPAVTAPKQTSADVAQSARRGPAVEADEVEHALTATKSTTVLRLPVHEGCADESACLDRVGVHYLIPGALWGPQGLYVDEQARFWICDSPGGRLAAFDASGKLVARIPYEHGGLGHLLSFAVTSSEAWLVGVGDQSDLPPLLRALSHAGEIIATARLVPGTTLMVPGRPDVFLSGGLRGGEVAIPRVIAGQIVLDPVATPAPFSLRCDGERHRGRLDTATRSVTFDGCFSPMRLNQDGSLDSYLTLGGSRSVARFAADGSPVASAVPPAPSYNIDIGFTHAAAGPQGEIYAVVPKRKVFEVVALGFADLSE